MSFYWANFPINLCTSHTHSLWWYHLWSFENNCKFYCIYYAEYQNNTTSRPTTTGESLLSPQSIHDGCIWHDNLFHIEFFDKSFTPNVEQGELTITCYHSMGITQVCQYHLQWHWTTNNMIVVSSNTASGKIKFVCVEFDPINVFCYH